MEMPYTFTYIYIAGGLSQGHKLKLVRGRGGEADEGQVVQLYNVSIEVPSCATTSKNSLLSLYITN